ncbi:MAG: hypothetical protein IPF93_25285 [Saprospiraceae bacterium]|nr:hypothetical protein [Saprospiraceae bacterium]
MKLAVIEFRGDARYVLKESVLNGGYRVIDDSLVAAIENYTSNGPYNHPLLAYTGATPAGYTPGTGGAGGTNYMAPLLAVDSLKERPDLLLFITDGMPTEVYTSNFVYSNSSTTACTATGNPAKVANKLKCEGTHIFAYGIAEATPGPLQDISDTTLFYELPGQSIANTDYVISNFTQLLVGLTDFVTQLCPLYTSTNSQDVCPGSSNGSITISVPPIYIPFDYAYFDQFGAVPLGTGTNVMTSVFSINGLPPGDYRVEIKIKLAPTCTRTETRIISIVPGAVNVDATITAITNPTCTNMNSGSATLNISAGESPFMITLKKASVIQPGYPIMNWAPTTFIAGSLMAGAYSIEVKDANLCNTDTSFFTIFSADTVKPVITCPSNITVYKDINCIADTSTVKTGQATATDNFSTVTTFNYTDSRTNGTCPYNYTINRTWTATDSCGNISLPCTQVITVMDTIKPVISCPAAITVYEDALCLADTTTTKTLKATATDNCSKMVTTFNYTDSRTNGTCPLYHYRPAAAILACLVPSHHVLVIKPMISCPAAITVYEDANCLADTTTTKTLKATATDNCSKMVTTFNYTDSKTNGTCPYNYTINRTWTATDSCGNISLPCSQIITVLDTIKPVISPRGNTVYESLAHTTPPNLAAYLESPPYHPTLKATTDNCSKMVTTFNYTDSRTNGTCPSIIPLTEPATDSWQYHLPCQRSNRILARRQSPCMKMPPKIRPRPKPLKATARTL